MTKETVRYPDGVVDSVEEVIADGVFESKSEFYRFSAEYVLDALLDDYDPESFDFEEIVDDLNDQHAFEHAGDGGTSGVDGGAFLDAVATVRKLGLRGEFESAQEFVDDAYADGDVESVLLEDVLWQYRNQSPGGDESADES